MDVARGGEPTLRSPLGDALAVAACAAACLPAHHRVRCRARPGDVRNFRFSRGWKPQRFVA
ncbi:MULTISPECIES: hypothetical protein [Streptomyces]|uniref:hypothetical protein n=1 Tax=Streptomyces TaxID=1883 RepID=UPI002889130C|nr:hypothetical protein [Streptomyces sp. Ag109_G2-6]